MERYRIIVLGVVMCLLYACKKDNGETMYPPAGACDTRNVSYANNIRPVINAQCLDCHSRGLTRYTFATHADVQTAALSGRLVASVSHQPGASPMPKDGPKLDSCTIEKIIKWVDAGAPDN